MSKVLVVFGATGQQGGSVISTVLADPELSKQFTLRAITRDTSTASAKALAQKGIEVIEADLDTPSSLTGAVAGAHTVFGVTVSIYDADLKAREVRQGRALADASVAAGAAYLIFSTLPDAGQISGSRSPSFQSFESKEEVEEYIRGLPIKSAFYAPGSFMSNFEVGLKPRPMGDGTYAMGGFVGKDMKLPCIDAKDDTGKYVAAILASPEELEGKVLSASTDVWTMEEIVQEMSRSSGKNVRYQQIPLDGAY